MPRYDLAGNPLPEDTPPRTDLAGNPLPASAPPPGYGAPQGYGQQPGAWPPPPSNGPYGRPPQQNTSGMDTTVPPEIAEMKWNWGAFALPFLWSLSHKIYGLAAIAFLLGSLNRLGGIIGAIVFFGFAIFMGLKGNEMGWRRRRFEGGVPQFISTQRVWMFWGIALYIIIGAAFIIGYAVRASSNGSVI